MAQPRKKPSDLQRPAAGVLAQLLNAKGESDRKNYPAKHNILRDMIKRDPGSFRIDSEEGGIYGLTHAPTGFRIHMPKAAAPPELRAPADVYIIRGNPDVDKEHAVEYDAFYDAIKKYVEARGLTAEFDPGLAHTSPPGGNYWIGHSRGVDRLDYAPENVKTLALDDYEPAETRQLQEEQYQKLFKELGHTDIASIPVDQRPQPGPEHYTFNDDMRTALDNLFLSKQPKTAADLEKEGAGDIKNPRVRFVLPYEDQYLMQEAISPKWKGWKRHAGGGIDEGEEPEDAALREFEEEFGKKLTRAQLKYLGLDPRGGTYSKHHFYEVLNHGLAPNRFQASNDPDEIVQLVKSLQSGDKYLGPDMKNWKRTRDKKAEYPEGYARDEFRRFMKGWKPGKPLHPGIQHHFDAYRKWNEPPSGKRESNFYRGLMHPRFPLHLELLKEREHIEKQRQKKPIPAPKPKPQFVAGTPDIVKKALAQVAKPGERGGYSTKIKLAADKTKHVLVTGHSGSGKTTLSKQLAEELGLPLFGLDDDPRWDKLITDPEMDDVARNTPGTPANIRFNKVRKQMVLDALARVKPHVIEGTQIAGSPEVWKDHRLVHVDTPELQVVRQRLGRDRLKPRRAGKMPPGSPMARERARIARVMIAGMRDELAQVAKDPRWERMRAKKASVLDGVIEKQAEGDPEAPRQISQLAVPTSVARMLQTAGQYDGGPNIWGKLTRGILPKGVSTPKALEFTQNSILNPSERGIGQGWHTGLPWWKDQAQNMLSLGALGRARKEGERLSAQRSGLQPVFRSDATLAGQVEKYYQNIPVDPKTGLKGLNRAVDEAQKAQKRRPSVLDRIGQGAAGGVQTRLAQYPKWRGADLTRPIRNYWIPQQALSQGGIGGYSDAISGHIVSSTEGARSLPELKAKLEPQERLYRSPPGKREIAAHPLLNPERLLLRDLGTQVDSEGEFIPVNQRTGTVHNPGDVPFTPGKAIPEAQRIFEHELTHQAYGGLTGPGRFTPARPSADYSSQGGDLTDHAYATTPLEMDPRLAEIKRGYAAATGKLVNDAASARAALKWWGEQLKEQPRLGSWDKSVFDSLMDNSKERAVMGKRLQEIVQNEPQQGAPGMPDQKVAVASALNAIIEKQAENPHVAWARRLLEDRTIPTRLVKALPNVSAPVPKKGPVSTYDKSVTDIKNFIKSLPDSDEVWPIVASGGRSKTEKLRGAALDRAGRQPWVGDLHRKSWLVKYRRRHLVNAAREARAKRLSRPYVEPLKHRQPMSSARWLRSLIDPSLASPSARNFDLRQPWSVPERRWFASDHPDWGEPNTLQPAKGAWPPHSRHRGRVNFLDAFAPGHDAPAVAPIIRDFYKPPGFVRGIDKSGAVSVKQAQPVYPRLNRPGGPVPVRGGNPLARQLFQGVGGPVEAGVQHFSSPDDYFSEMLTIPYVGEAPLYAPKRSMWQNIRNLFTRPIRRRERQRREREQLLRTQLAVQSLRGHQLGAPSYPFGGAAAGRAALNEPGIHSMQTRPMSGYPRGLNYGQQTFQQAQARNLPFMSQMILNNPGGYRMVRDTGERSHWLHLASGYTFDMANNPDPSNLLDIRTIPPRQLGWARAQRWKQGKPSKDDLKHYGMDRVSRRARPSS